MIEYDLLKAWCEAAGLQREGTLVDFSLRVQTDLQKQLLRTVYDSIEAIGPILMRWQQNGTDTMGMAEFAHAWSQRPASFDGHKGISGRAVGRPPIDSEFKNEIKRNRLDRDRDALYLLMQCQVPEGEDTQAHLTLRAWVFVKGLQLAHRGTTASRLMASACKGLRRAAYQLPGESWRQALQPLGIWTRTHEDLTAHLAPKPKSGSSLNSEVLGGEHSSVVKHIGRLAAGEIECLEERSDTAPVRAEDFESLFARKPESSDAPDESQERLASPNIVDGIQPPPTVKQELAEDDEEPSGHDVDPDASPYEKQLQVKSAQFQIGAAARFLLWDWPQISPPERMHFDRLLQASLGDPEDEHRRLLAAFSWLAREMGLSLDRCLQVPIEPLDPRLEETDWRIDLAQGMLRRRPPRRGGHKRPTDEQTNNLCLAADYLNIPVAPAVVAVLQAAFRRRLAPRFLGQLWRDPSRRVDSAFRKWVRGDPQVRRLQPAMLGRMLGQRTFEITGDHVLARLLPSTPSAALPSSTVYGAYHESDLRRVWPGATGSPSSSYVDFNVAGSLLDLGNDEVLADAFRHARKEIEKFATTGNWIDFHNGVACYWDAALRAATGVRPTDDLWFSQKDIDWDLEFAFVDDKDSPVSQSGRLIPIPSRLCSEFRTHYLERHLPWVLGRLSGVSGSNSFTVPMLFVIGREGHRVMPIGHEHRAKLEIEKPLPLNVFRHRLRTRLTHSTDADPEVVDSIMGHSDGATLTHGDYSMRTWLGDAEAIRGPLTSIYDALAIQAPPRWIDFASLSRTQPLAAGDKPLHYVKRSRRPARRQSLSIAAAALRIIHRYLRSIDGSIDSTAPPVSAPVRATKPAKALLDRLARLSKEEVEVLSGLLLKRPDGYPATKGVLQYEFLLRLSETLWSRHGQRLAQQRRYTVRELEDSPFRSEAVGAVTIMMRLRQALDTMFDAAPTASRLSLRHALALLVFDLCLTSRITIFRVHKALLEGVNHWRVVRLEECYYFEWSPERDLTADRDAACMRFPISARAAWLLTVVIRHKTRRGLDWSAAAQFAQPLADALFSGELTANDSAPSIDSTLTHIRRIVDQCNIIELPGTVAGYLSGRVWTASLGWGDWLQVRQGRWTDTSSVPLTLLESAMPAIDSADPRFGQIEDDGDGPVEPVPATRPTRQKKSKGAPNARSMAALSLVREVQEALRKLNETRGISKRRKVLAEVLSKKIRLASSDVSQTIRLLCLWVIDLLLRPGRKPLASSSVARYFVALSPSFLAIGCDKELERMDDREIEAFYAQVLEIANVQQIRIVYDCLRNFHRFGHHVAGLPEIDWSNLAIPGETIFGAPGFIDDATYLLLLKRLGADTGCAVALPWQLQCFVLFAYRFGLRGKEVAGLTRSDVVEDGQSLRILVSRNESRGVKTEESRRIVPLLFELTDEEKTALRLLKDSQLPNLERADTETPIFLSKNVPDTLINEDATRAYINAAIKQITGQWGSTLHDLRHAFAARVWAATQAPMLPVAGHLPREEQRRALVETLLGSKGPIVTRRSPWALARLLGHAHPNTALRSYVHSLSDVLDSILDLKTVHIPEHIDLDDVRCPRLDGAPSFVSAGTNIGQVKNGDPILSPSTALDALRHIAAGRTDAEVATYSRLPLQAVRELRAIDSAIFDRLSHSKRAGLDKHIRGTANSARLAPSRLLAFLHASAYQRLRDGLAGLSPEQRAELATLDSVPVEHWAAMIGERREISMWTREHFNLFGFVLRNLTGDSRVVELRKPASKAKEKTPKKSQKAGKNTDSSQQASDDDDDEGVGSSRQIDPERQLLDLAWQTGWIDPSDPLDLIARVGQPALCRYIGEIVGAPSVRLGESGLRVERRLVMLFSGAQDACVQGRMELVVCAICVNLFTKQSETVAVS